MVTKPWIFKLKTTLLFKPEFTTTLQADSRLYYILHYKKKKIYTFLILNKLIVIIINYIKMTSGKCETANWSITFFFYSLLASTYWCFFLNSKLLCNIIYPFDQKRSQRHNHNKGFKSGGSGSPVKE